MGARLMAVAADGDRGRVYLSPTAEQEKIALSARPHDPPDGTMVDDARAFTPSIYGLGSWESIFTHRQLVALTTLSDVVGEAPERVRRDGVSAELRDDGKSLLAGGTGATAYAEAIASYLGVAFSRYSNAASTICTWNPGKTKEDIRFTFSRQALQMTWDFAEGNPFSDSSGNLADSYQVWVCKALVWLAASATPGVAQQADAATQRVSLAKVVSTDPPYFDNVPYADLSDYFYLWLRRALKPVFPDLFATLAVPKAEELVAAPYRHNGRAGAEAFFMNGMTEAMRCLSSQAHPAFPVTIYYAFKQQESDGQDGTASTGWDTFLEAVIRSGFAVTGTWPIRTERGGRSRDIGSSALASSIVLVCRPHPVNAATATRREFVNALKAELPTAVSHLQRSNIAPVDLAQAAIGPGMAVYTRYAKVLDAEGKSMPVREALALINETLDEVLAEQEGDFDADTRWTLAWFEQSGFAEGEYGVAETLSKAKNTSVGGMVEAGVVESKRGKVRLLSPDELPEGWDPVTDSRLTVWEMVHHLIRVLESGGESAAATLAGKLGSRAEVARELAYRLYTISERKKRAQEALRYNALVQSWPEISRLAREGASRRAEQASLFEMEGS